MRLALVALLSVAVFASSVRADKPCHCACVPAAPDTTLRRQEWVKYRLQERSEIGVGWPIVGVVLGAFMVTSGVGLIASTRDPERARNYGGTVLGLLGLPVAIVSTTVLTKRVHKRRDILRDIGDRAALGGFGFRF